MVYDQELHRRQYHGLYGEQERHPTEHTQEDWALNTLSFNFPIKILSRAESRRHLARDNSYKKKIIQPVYFTIVLRQFTIYIPGGRAESEVVVPTRTPVTE